MIWKDMPAFQKKGERDGSDIFISGTVHHRVFYLEEKAGHLLPQ